MEETVESRACIKKGESDWLSTLLQSKFFGHCVPHQELAKNEKNSFCIDCNLGICRHCVADHLLHRHLKLCRYLYHDCVRLHDLERFLDCSKIQTYITNGAKAIHLNPRPQSQDPRSKTDSGACEACGRRIRDDAYSFCSIACKASMDAVKDQGQSSTITASARQEEEVRNASEVESSISVAESAKEREAGVGSSMERVKRPHRRKGIPVRSPFS